MIESQICKFYNDQKILITGGTGFMGKVLIEKLLRSTNVSNIYLVIRSKKSKSPQTRFEEMFDDVLFEKLQKTDPNFKNRLTLISGNFLTPSLDLNEEDIQLLISNVNVVFHVAATVRFDENIKVAFDVNVKGTKNLLDFCKQMKQLKSIVHVSTAYSYCIINTIDEVFYDPPVSCEELEATLNKVSMEEAEKLTPSIIKEWPNTYSFTKCLAENVIKTKSENLPIGIFRPPIVVSTYKEPLEGWTNSFAGPTGGMIATGLGIIRILPADPNIVPELVPVDKAIAALIATAWDVYNENQKHTAIKPIYNFVSSNCATWQEVADVGLEQARLYPLSKALWSPRIRVIKISKTYNVIKFLYDYIPSLIFEILTLGKYKLLSVYDKVAHLAILLSYFGGRKWNYVDNNTKRLWRQMNQDDKEVFDFNMETVDWFKFLHSYCKGLRVYLLKDPLDTLPEAKIRAQRLNIAHNVMLFLMYFIGMNILGYIVLKIFECL